MGAELTTIIKADTSHRKVSFDQAWMVSLDSSCVVFASQFQCGKRSALTWGRLGGYPFGNMSWCRSCVPLMRPLHGADQGDASDLTAEAVALWVLHPRVWFEFFQHLSWKDRETGHSPVNQAKRKMSLHQRGQKDIGLLNPCFPFYTEIFPQLFLGNLFQTLAQPWSVHWNSNSGVLEASLQGQILFDHACDRISCLSFPNAQ